MNNLLYSSLFKVAIVSVINTAQKSCSKELLKILHQQIVLENAVCTAKSEYHPLKIQHCSHGWPLLLKRSSLKSCQMPQITKSMQFCAVECVSQRFQIDFAHDTENHFFKQVHLNSGWPRPGPSQALFEGLVVGLKDKISKWSHYHVIWSSLQNPAMMLGLITWPCRLTKDALFCSHLELMEINPLHSFPFPLFFYLAWYMIVFFLNN